MLLQKFNTLFIDLIKLPLEGPVFFICVLSLIIERVDMLYIVRWNYVLDDF
jgi:hypothetical protein